MPNRRESFLAAVLWLAALAVNLATATRSPTAWHDEVYFADPAVHFAMGEGYRTTAWTLVGEDVRWPGLVPGYGYALGAWLTALGVGLWQVRALPIVLAAIAVGWVWWTARWRGHAGSSGAGLVLLALLLCGAGTVFSYRSGRGDALAMLWWAAAYAAASRGDSRLSLIALFVLGLVAPWCGLFLVPYVGIMGVILLCLEGRRWVGRVGAAYAGLAVGLAALAGYYRMAGAWEAFVACSREYQSGVLSPHFRLRLDGLWDASLLLVLAALAWAALVRERGCAGRRIASVALGAAPTTGLVLALMGKFPAYYSWLVFFPSAVALAHVIPCTARPGARRVLVALAGLAIVVGLPARIGACLMEWGARDHGRVAAFVARHFREADRVACHPSAYFALRPVVGEVYPRATEVALELPAEVRRTITAACVRPEIDAGRLVEGFGGRWVRVADLDAVPGPSRPGRAELYRLVAYRRVEETIP